MINKRAIYFLLILFFFNSCAEQERKDENDKKKETISRSERGILFLADSLKKVHRFGKSNALLLTAAKRMPFSNSSDLLIKLNNRLAYNYRRMGSHDSAFYYCNTALKIAAMRDVKDSLTIAQTHYLLGLLYKDFREVDSGLVHLKQSMQIRRRILGDKNPSVGDVYNNMGVLYAMDNNFRKSLFYFNEAVRLRKKRGANHYSVASTFMNMANLYQDIGDLEKSLAYYDSALIVQKNINPDNLLIADILLNQANTFDKLGKIDESIKRYKTALKIYLKVYGREHPYVAIAYNNIALQYINWNDYEKAAEYLWESIRIKKKLGASFKKELVDNYMNLGILYVNLRKYNSAIEVFNEGIRIGKKLKNKTPQILSGIYFYLADIYLELGNREKGLMYADTAYLAVNSRSKSTPYVRAVSEYKMAEIYLDSEQLNKAESHINLALKYFEGEKSVLPHWYAYAKLLKAKTFYGKKKYRSALEILSELDDEYSFPDGKLDLNKIIKYGLGEVFIDGKQIKARSYLRLSNKSLNIAYLEKGENEVVAAAEVFEKVRNVISTEKSKIELSKKMGKVFDLGIEIAYKINIRNPNQANFETALNFSENKKSLMLLELLSESKVFELSGVPDSVIINQKRLRTKIFEKERSINELMKTSGKGNETIEKLRNEKFSLRVKYETEEKRLREKYPVFSALRFKALKLSLSSILQNIIPARKTFIEYSLVDKYLYAFVISDAGYNFVRTPLPKDISEFTSRLIKSITEQNKTEYSRLAYSAYKLLIKPIEPLITTKRVLIINEGVLGYVPFDALLSNDEGEEVSYKEYSYLVKKYSFGYAFSFGILSRSESANNIVKSFVGIAPLTE